mmetsp:Transcript_106185/g.342541  ORF Transcript_106185/g.342541 Transcript_106185/m.342541 type:complete len:202 (+) Transcript_106185:228-833(+)
MRLKWRSSSSSVTSSGMFLTLTSVEVGVACAGSRTCNKPDSSRSLLLLRNFMALRTSSVVSNRTRATKPPWMVALRTVPTFLKWSFSSCHCTAGVSPCTRTVFIKSVLQSSSTRSFFPRSVLPSNCTLASHASSARRKRSSPKFSSRWGLMSSTGPVWLKCPVMSSMETERLIPWTFTLVLLRSFNVVRTTSGPKEDMSSS